jgi:hypothetical protein
MEPIGIFLIVLMAVFVIAIIKVGFFSSEK